MLKYLNRRSAPPEAKTTSLASLLAMHGAGQAADHVPPPGFSTNVIAYRCVRMIAEAAAAVPLVVMEQGERLIQSGLGDLLEKPNPDQSGIELLEEVYGFLQTHGGAYLERVRDETGTRALFLLHPDDIEKTKTGYRYRAATNYREFRVDAFGQTDLLALTLWHPSRGAAGQAPLRTAAGAIHLHNAACAWNKQLLENAARPSGALVHRGDDGSQHLTPEQFDRLRNELDQGFSGLRGAGRPLLLDGGLDWRPMGLTPAEMDFQNLKDSSARDIALAFGVPPMLLGIPGDNTYSNYAQANLAFWRQTVLPLVRKVSMSLSAWLDPGRTLKIEPDLAGLEALAPERSARLDRIAAADFLTDREKRMALGFSPEPEGAVQ